MWSSVLHSILCLHKITPKRCKRILTVLLRPLLLGRKPYQFWRHHLSFIPVCEWQYLCIAARAPHWNKISEFFSCRQRQRREWIGSFIQPKLSVQRISILLTRKKRNQNLKLKNSSLVAKMLHYRTLLRIKSSDKLSM